MVNVKKSIGVLKHFILILTLLTSTSNCWSQLVVTQIEGKQININEKAATLEKYDSYVAPFRTRINGDLDNILAVCPETLDKSKGQWQTSIGDLIANLTLAKTIPVFRKREGGKEIDICLLNHGGIRAILPKGNVTTRTAFEIMPFENTTVVVALKGDKINEIVNYFIKEKKPHPLAGLTFTIDVNNQPQNIRVKNQPVILTKTYYVVTSDYLSNGGDNMTFFKDGTVYDLEYKLRNIIIDYFKDVDTIPVVQEIKITQEK